MPVHNRPIRRLRNLLVKEVSLVDDGDNPGARVSNFKRRTARNRPGQPGYDPSKRRAAKQQPSSGQVSTPVPLGEREGPRRRRRPRRRPGALDGDNQVAKLTVVLQTQESGGRSPHQHRLVLPDGPIAAGTFRSSRVQDHDHAVELPDIQPGDVVNVQSGGAIPDPPAGITQHGHSVTVRATDAVQAGRGRLRRARTDKQEQDFQTRDGQRFRRNAFAFAPAGSPASSWRLALFDSPADANANRPSIRLTAAAAQALSSAGFRGQPVAIPRAQRSAVIRRVRAAWLRARRDRDVTRDDLPAVLKGRLEMFDRMISAITKWAGKPPDEALRKRLFDEVRADSQREQVVDVLMGRVGDLAKSIREILFDPDADGGDAQGLVRESLGQFASSIDDELGEVFAGRIVKELADRDDPPDLEEVEQELETIFTDSTAYPAGDEEEEVEMDLSKLSKEDRERLEAALEGAETLESVVTALAPSGGDEGDEEDEEAQILKDLPENVRKILGEREERLTDVTKENATLKARLDKIEADSAKVAFEKSVGDLAGIPQKRDELIDTLWAIPDEAAREQMRKNLEGAATAARRGAFSEIGSGITEGGSAYAQIEAAAEEIRKVHPEMSEAVSKAKAMELHPDLYDQYLEEDTGRLN